ncbi:MAG: hypothetical protein IJ793_03715 [Opitutales bacterium]|nr:hypothetical protein [Opitutales bacterium]
MDFEDIAHAVWVGVIIVVAVLSGRSKRVSVLVRKSKPSGTPDVGRVRKPIKTIGKLIKAPRRPCNTNPQTSPSHTSRSDIPLSPVKRNFSAYKHLPEQTTAEESVSDATVFLTEPKASVVLGVANNIQRGVVDKKTKLREWVTGQVILGTPAFRKTYGNFFHR